MTFTSFAAPLLLYYIPLTIATASIVYYLLILLASLRFRSEREPRNEFRPPVSLLKPLRGADESLFENLATHCRQQYPQFEMIFGLADPADPATDVIARLRSAFPQVPIKTVIAPESRSANQKVNSLQVMLAAASHEFIVINDADIAVPSDYLQTIIQPLLDDRVGMVTCLYRGAPARNWASLFGALNIAGDFAGQVLLARWLEGIRFALGATMATRKRQIAAVGGPAPWGDYLADDYILGNRIAAAGYRIHLSHMVVDTVVSHGSFSELLRQQLRWARTVRFSRPGSYPGLLLVFGLIFAAVALGCRLYSPLAQWIFAAILLARFLAAWASGVLICGDRTLRKFFWLLPVRDLIAFGVWLASFFGAEVVWRGQRFRIESDGKIRRV